MADEAVGYLAEGFVRGVDQEVRTADQRKLGNSGIMGHKGEEGNIGLGYGVGVISMGIAVFSEAGTPEELG